MSRDRNLDNHVKKEAVSLVIDSGKSITSVSREIDIPKSTLENWVRLCIFKKNNYEIDSNINTEEKSEVNIGR